MVSPKNGLILPFASSVSVVGIIVVKSNQTLYVRKSDIENSFIKTDSGLHIAKTTILYRREFVDSKELDEVDNTEKLITTENGDTLVQIDSLHVRESDNEDNRVKTEFGDTLIKTETVYVEEDGNNNNDFKVEHVYVKVKTFYVKSESGDDIFIKVDAMFVPKVLDSKYVFVKTKDAYVRRLESEMIESVHVKSI